MISHKQNNDSRKEIKFEGIVYKIGSFETEIEAAIAYNKRFKELNNTNTEPNIINNN